MFPLMYLGELSHACTHTHMSARTHTRAHTLPPTILLHYLTHTPPTLRTHSASLTFPEQISYNSIPPANRLVNASQLGVPFLTTFIVRNSGPSTIPNIQLTINWPLNGTETGSNFYLYPALIRVGRTVYTYCMVSVSF